LFKILALIAIFFASLASAQVTIPFNNTLGPSQYIDITPAGGFSAGTTLSSFSITLTNYAVVSGGSVLDDLTVIVAPATPTSANAVFATNNAGGFTAPSMEGLTPALSVPGTGAVNLSTPISLFGMKLWIGNVYPATATWAGSFTYPSILASPAPTVTSINPVQGSTTGGTSVTLTGTDLTGATSITFGGTACTNVIVVSSTSATCTSPAGTAGTASVLVTTSGGTNAANTLFTYSTPVAAPIPTLSEWAMIFLASLMGLFAFTRIRRQS
jgi:hypothetical protein